MDMITAVAALAITAFPPRYLGPSMQLDGTGTVYRCQEEKKDRNLTCFWVGTEAWMVRENRDRPAGTTFRVRFWLQAMPESDDAFTVLRVEIVQGVGCGDDRNRIVRD